MTTPSGPPTLTPQYGSPHVTTQPVPQPAPLLTPQKLHFGMEPQPLLTGSGLESQPVVTPVVTSACSSQYLSPPIVQPAASTPLQLAGFDPIPGPRVCTPFTYTSHQLKSVATFSGSRSEKHALKVEDWVRDMKYLLEVKGPQPQQVCFHELVRHTSGRARDVILNLERHSPTPPTVAAAFTELLEEFGEDHLASSPIASFYARVQRPEESGCDFAIALEALLRRVEEMKQRQGRPDSLGEDRDLMLTTQFMAGLTDELIKQRLAPMQPRRMTFKALRRELHVIAEERRLAKEAQQRKYRLLQQTSPSDNPVQSNVANTKTAESGGKPLSAPMPPSQVADLTVLIQKQTDTLQRVLDGQRILGERVEKLEAHNVFGAPAWPRQPTPMRGPPVDVARREGLCFRCGAPDHLARLCPNRQAPLN